MVFLERRKYILTSLAIGLGFTLFLSFSAFRNGEDFNAKKDKVKLVEEIKEKCWTDEVVHNRNLRLSCRFLFNSKGLYDFLPDQLEIENMEKIKFTQQPPSCNRYIELLIAVNSAAHNQAKREAIRKTWKPALEAHGNITVIFLAGTTMDNKTNEEIIKEAENRKDIVLMQVIDEYRRLTIKNLLMFRWLRDSCTSAKFLLKCDDDMSFNPHILNFVRREFMRKDDNNIYGKVLGAGPMRGSRWDLTTNYYPSGSYPNYLAGPVVFQSRAIAMKLLDVLQLLPTFGIDDIIVNGIAAALSGVNPVSHRSLNGIKPLPKNPKLEYPAFAWLTGGEDKILSDWKKLEEFYKTTR